MMREHMGLYRGKRKDNGEWAEGNLIKLHDGRCYVINNKFGACIDADGNFIMTEAPFVCEVDPDTVGECTGMQENGKLIFEGDILEREYLGEKHRYTVVYSQDAFAWGEKNKYGLTGRLCKGIGTIEIIGNIHDNPELMGSEGCP